MDSPVNPFRTIMTGVTAIFLATSYRLLPSIISDYSYVDRMDVLNTQQHNKFAPEEYDFIVVGAGSSGSLVANRLQRHFKTLLLEAGGTPFPLQNIPALAPLMIGHKDLEWRYYTAPQTYSCMSLSDREMPVFSARVLGGTSMLNFMAWNRGHPIDYDSWAEITGDKRWSYNELLPFFKKSERYSGQGNETYHGYKGEITISPVPYKPLVKYFLGAAEELGYPIGDLNAPYDEMFNEHCFNHNKGERQSAYHAFLQPLEEDWRSGLTLRKYAHVTRVLIQDHKPHRTYGVQYEQGGRFYTAISRKEVIISAGAIGSPKLLMLSGVGPAKHLEQVGIKPIVDLPGVGRNLMDHVAALVGPFHIDNAPQSVEHLTYLPSRDSRPFDIIDLLSNGRGPLTQSGSMASGFLVSDNTTGFVQINGSKRAWPDTQLILIGIPQDSDGLIQLTKMFNLEPAIAKEYYDSVLNKDSFSIMTSVARPKSRGFIKLASKDPFQDPIIDPNYYSNPEDMKVMRKAISKTLELVQNTKSFYKIGAKLVKTPFPSCKHEKYLSAEYWECFAREFTVSLNHPSGTCSMGKVDNRYSVVDSSLKVKGTKGLRVIDASVMAQIVTSNINPACTVIAERGVQMILDEYLERSG